MKETHADTRVALLQAAGLHALLFVLMFAGLQWTRHSAPPAAQGEPIEAEIVQASDLSRSLQRALKRTPNARPVPEPTPPPAPLPPPVREPVPPAPPAPKQLPPPVPRPDTREQEKVQRNAASEERAKAKREQEEKRRQAKQVELEARKQKQQTLDRQKQAQLAMLRKLRENASRERALAEQRVHQRAEAAIAPTARPGSRGTDTSLVAQYEAALQQAILRQWTRPETVALGQVCKLTIRQIPGGEVIDVQVAAPCAYDALGQRSVEAAVRKASPLPYAGYASVFRRTLELNFKAEDR